jgi:Ca-activated chloride channel family protein
MSLAYPWALLLLPLAALPLLCRGADPIPVPSLARWAAAEKTWRARWRERLPWFRAACCALLVAGIAGPRRESPSGDLVRQGIAIELLVDISSSMDQNIEAPGEARKTRMEAAKEVVAEFVRRRPDDLIGLITFARYADTLGPLTFGHEALAELVAGLKVQDLPNEDGTAYGDALALACARLGQLDELRGDATDGPPGPPIGSRVVVLLTDGENNCGLHLPEEAAGFAKKQGIRVHTITVQDGSGGEPTEAERLLERIAGETGGGYWAIRDAGDLSAVYAEIDRLETSAIRTADPRRVIRPLFAWAILPALLFGALAEAASATFLRVAEEAR